MITSKYSDPLNNFVNHGVKTVSAFDYILLIDQTGQTLIERVASDGTSIMFAKMPVPASTSYPDIATAISSYWSASIENYTYAYLFQL